MGRSDVVARGSYNTRQRKAVQAFLQDHASRYLSVDDTYAMLREQGVEVGRTTVYRTLEAFVGEGLVSKATMPDGGESRYRLVEPGHEEAGRLVCLDCGRVISIDCAAFQEFSRHVRSDHDFDVDLARTVLYGRCSACRTRAAR